MGLRIGGLIGGGDRFPAGKGRRRFGGLAWDDLLSSGVAVGALSLLAGFISLPLISLAIWTVSSASWRAMASPVAVDALLLSAKTTAVTMAIVLVVGTPAAYALARFEFPGKRIIDTLVDIPAVLPPSAAGIALLLAFGRFGVLGEHLQALGVTVTFTMAAVVLAQVFVASHFYVRQAAVGFGRVSREVEEAAQVDGAGRAIVFFKVTVPLTFPALVSGAGNGLGPGTRRVRGHANYRRELPGRYPDDAIGDLLGPGERLRCRHRLVRDGPRFRVRRDPDGEISNP